MRNIWPNQGLFVGALLFSLLTWPLNGALSQNANLETRLDTTLPAPPARVLRPNVRTVEETRYEPVQVSKTVDVPVPLPEVRMLIEKSGKALPAAALSRAATCKVAKDANISCFRKETRRVVEYRARTEKRDIVEPRKTSFSVAAPLSYSYQSNAFSAATARSDFLFNVTPQATLSIPFNTADTLSFVASLGLPRYDRFAVLDRDIILGQVSYARALSATQTIALKYTDRSSWLPGFSEHSATIRQAAFDWTLDKIDVGGPICSAGKASTNCFLANLAVSAGHSWFENVAALDNLFTRITLGLDWNIIPSQLVLKVSGSLTGRNYEHNPSDRADLLYALSTTIAWTPNSQISMSAGVAYARQESSVTAVEYKNYELLPQIRVTAVLGEWAR